MDLWLIEHHHRYGTTRGFIRADHEPGEDECIRALGLDYEPDKEEYIEITLVNEAEIATLPATHQR